MVTHPGINPIQQDLTFGDQMTVGFFSLGQAVYRICCLIYTLDIHAFLQIVSVPLNSPRVLHFVHEIQVHYIWLTLPVVINRSSF